MRRIAESWPLQTVGWYVVLLDAYDHVPPASCSSTAAVRGEPLDGWMIEDRVDLHAVLAHVQADGSRYPRGDVERYPSRPTSSCPVEPAVSVAVGVCGRAQPCVSAAYSRVVVRVGANIRTQTCQVSVDAENVTG